MNVKNIYKGDVYMKKKLSVAIWSIIIVFIIYFIFAPTISFFIGFAMGGFVKLFAGGFIVKGFKLLNIDFNVNAIPYITGMIACFSSFLPQKLLSNSNKKGE